MRKIFFLILVFAMLVAFSPAVVQASGGTDASVPSNLSLWWQGVKESVSLGLTFDPVKKAEKSLNYAEKRMKIAEQFAAQTNNPKAQEKAEEMIKKAQGFMEKIQAGQKKWMNSNKKEKKIMLMKNVANYQENKATILDRIESGLSEEQKDKFNELRVKGIKINERLMTALGNENIPEEVRAQLEEVKMRIEAHSEEVKAYIQKRSELREQIKAGDKNAIEELKGLNTQRREEMQNSLQNIMKKKGQIRQDLQKAGAAIRGQVQNRVQNIDTAKIKQRREEVQKIIKEREKNSSSTGVIIDRTNTGGDR